MLRQQKIAFTEVAREARVEMGLWLKSLREGQGLSQRDLAGRLDLDYYTFISQLENGRGRIPPARYREWAAALGQDPRDFVKTLMSYCEPHAYEILFGPSSDDGGEFRHP